jgi:hypothetical protein
MANGIRVTDGKRISAANPDNLLYSSDFQSPKIWSTKTGSFTTDASGNAVIDMPHGLVYTPAVFAYIKKDDGNWYGIDNQTSAVETSSLYCTIRTLGLTANHTYQYKFWIFTDPAQDI